jgi:nitroimidazol reductase NimA-like FMN-containing flavoprotein (pyridoxamine 5'-phosphate oxidase superfamily)
MTSNPPTPEHPVVELPEDECWALLSGEQVGRLAYRLADEIHVVPLNYKVRDRTVLVLTAEGNKLLAAEMGSEVALEADWFDAEEAWSVLVRGRLRRLGEGEARAADLDALSWIPTFKYDVVQVVPTAVTGRRFCLARR